MDFSLSTDERAIQSLAHDFVRHEIVPVAARHDLLASFPHAVVAKARELGLMNLGLPPEYGGCGAGALTVAAVAEELAWGCAGIAACIMLNDMVALPLLLAGTSDQQAKYFDLLRGGVAAYALTEPDAGSDAAAIGTLATRTARGYRLTGRKTWISHAPEAGFFVVFAKTDPEAGSHGISAFLVDRAFAGVSVGTPLPKMGQRASSAAELTLSDVEVPAEALLGAEGEGFTLAMNVFDRSRSMVAAFGVGVAQRALDEAVAYADTRVAFGRPIKSHEGIGFKLAEIGMRTEAARLLTQKAAWLADAGRSSTLAAAYAKTFAADTAMWAAVEAVQVFGGHGYSQDYPVEKLMRDAKLLQIYEGTNEIQRVVMARELTGGRAWQNR